MGRPVLEFVTSGNTAANVTAFDATVHGGTVNADDILFILVGNDGPGDTVDAAAGGYAVLAPSPARANSPADNGAGTMLWRRAAGGDDATPTVTISSSEGASWVGGRISGVPTDVDPEIAVLAGAVSSINPDPPALDPTWDATAIPTLWGMFYVWDGNVSHVGYPAGWTENQRTDRWANTGGFGIAFATLPAADSDVASVNPPAGEISASDQWASFTIAFPGTAGGGATPQALAVGMTMTPAIARRLMLVEALAVGMTMTPAASRQATFGKPLDVGMTMTPSLARSVAKLLAVAMTLAPALAAARSFARTLAVGMTMAPDLSSMLVNERTLAVGMTMAPALGRRATHLVELAVAVSMAVGFVRTFSVTLAVGVAMLAAAQRGLFVDMAVATTLVPAVSTSFRTTRTLAAASTLAPGVQKTVIPGGGAGGPGESSDQTARHLVLRR